MTFSQLIHRIGRFATDNSPALLTAVGVTGTIATAVLAGRASFKAAEMIRFAAEDAKIYPDEIEAFEKFKLVWPEYIPAVGVGAGTIACIILANRVGSRRAAAMATAFALSEKAFDDYRNKVVEKLGTNKEQDVRTELAQERVRNNPPQDAQIILTGEGDHLCYDIYTDRYFQSTVEAIKKAVNDTNYVIIHHDYASLNEFYGKIGLPNVQFGDDMGWSNLEKLDVRFDTVLAKGDRPTLTLEFHTHPVRNYYKTH